MIEYVEMSKLKKYVNKVGMWNSCMTNELTYAVFV